MSKDTDKQGLSHQMSANKMWGGRFSTSPAEIMEEIGWDTRLIDLTEPQVLTLIEVAVGGFQDAMHATARNVDSPEIPF